MLEKSSKLDDSLMDAYRSIHEIHKGHAAGDSDLEKQASQLASDIRYKAKGRIKEGANAEDKKRVYLSLLAASTAPSIVKTKAKKKLLGESVTEDAAYDKVLKDLKGQFGSGVLGTGEKPKEPSKKSQRKSTRKRAASNELERRFRVRNPKVTSGRYPKDDEEGDKRARKREKDQGVRPESLPGVNETAPAVAKIIDAVREDATYGYDKKGRSLNPKDIKKRKKVSEGKLIHGPFGPYITGQKMPKEHKETPLKQVPYEGLNGNRKAVGEAKVDQGLDDEAKEDARNYRRFGTRHNQHGTAVLRRSLERSKRGEKKVKGAKSVEEEVGLSSSAKMKEAQKEAARQRKEQQAVEKEKKALKKEETAPAVAKIIEKIQINKVSPKSPNCIIMPRKDEYSDNGKKSTKDVVTKKHKQFFNKEDKVKTFRQFVTETEQIDEILGFAKLASAATKVGQVAKGTSKVVGAAAKTGADVAGKIGSEGIRVAKDVAKHAPSAIEKGSEVAAKGIRGGKESLGSSIKSGIDKARHEYQANKIKASNPNINPKKLAKKASREVKISDRKWADRKKTAGKVLKAVGGDNPGQLASNIDTISRSVRGDGNRQKPEHARDRGGRTGTIRNPT